LARRSEERHGGWRRLRPPGSGPRQRAPAAPAARQQPPAVPAARQRAPAAAARQRPPGVRPHLCPGHARKTGAPLIAGWQRTLWFR